jgi:glycosyltransferase involved in cell wall biosynthesis
VDLSWLPQGGGIELTGYLEDVRPAVAGSWLAVAPLKSGGGTRLKILEAMALGTPVVATSKGAEGLAARHGEEILIADDGEGLARSACGCWKVRRCETRSAAKRGGGRVLRLAAIGEKFCGLVEAVAETGREERRQDEGTPT